MAEEELGEELAKASIDLNETIEEAESTLASFMMGVRARVVIDEAAKLKLCFGKHMNAWRLLIEDYKTDRERPLITASLEVRLKAVEKLPELAQAMVNEAEVQIEQVKEAIASLKKVIAALRGT